MQHSRSFSNFPSTTLVKLFVQRSGKDGLHPAEVMGQHIEALRDRVKTTGLWLHGFDAFLQARKIDDLCIVDNLSCDGFIEPKGLDYSHGFRMVLCGGRPSVRQRFTKAHELCHSFFYELVPEIKFAPHETNPEEEWLCNLGASELLMPRARVSEDASDLLTSLKSLERLARAYEVSPHAMLLLCWFSRNWRKAILR